jgi:cytochrome P450
MELESGGPSPRPTSAIPGPTGPELREALARYARDPLGESLALFEVYGDLVAMRRGPFLTVHAFHPDHARHVLVDHPDRFSRRTTPGRVLSSILGDGLITVDPPRWHDQRRATIPGFTRRALEANLPVIEQIFSAQIDELLERSAAGPIDVHEPLALMLLEVICQVVLGRSFDRSTLTRVRSAVEVSAASAPRSDLVAWTEGKPALDRAAFAERHSDYWASAALLDELVTDAIREHAKDGEQSTVLGALLGYRRESGAPFDEGEVRAQIKTLLLAGHETTLSALAFVLELLSRNPAELELVHDEVRRVGGDGPLSGLAQTDLPYAAAVVAEALRLYPPVPHLDRRAEVADVLGGYQVPRGTNVTLSPWVTQRRADLWPEPLRFEPRRFLERTPPGYLPFSLGPRTCIGRGLALLELQLFTALLARRARLVRDPGFELEVVPVITLHPRDCLLPLALRPR